MPIDGLPRGVRSRITRRIFDQLRTDPVLSSVVKHWNTYTGKIDDAVPSTPTQTAIQLLPLLGPTTWSSADAHRGKLIIQIEMWLPGQRLGLLDAEAALDLFEAFENAIYPRGQQAKRQAFEQSLRDLGCVSGQCQFQQPATVAGVDKDGFYLLGSMVVDIERQLDT